MKRTVSVGLVGINGYGHVYLKELLKNTKNVAYLAGVVDIQPEKSDYYQQLIDLDIPIYLSLEEFYQNKHADLIIISTPIHLHKEQACYAMKHGSNVLCEKPITGNPNDIQEMIDTRDRYNKFLAIGFNWSFTASVQELKQDILNGKYGKIKRLKSLALWPRNQDYYTRSDWVGKKYSSSGQMIFDSVANNATAHFLHHLFYLSGGNLDTSAQIKEITAELYKANPIETFDTCAVQVRTTDNVEIFYYASHAVIEQIHPRFELEFEEATITYKRENNSPGIVAQLNDGTEKVHQDPELDHLAKLHVCVDAIINGTKDIFCGPEAASTHVTCIQSMHQSVPNIPSFPEEIIRFKRDQRLNWVEGLGDTLIDCYKKGCLPSDMNIEWSSRGEKLIIN